MEPALLFKDVTSWSGLSPRPVRILEFGISAGDLDDDGDDDLIAPAADRFEVWLNNGTGQFWSASEFGENGAVTTVLGQWVGGPALDVLALSGFGVVLHEGNGDGTFVSSDQFVAPSNGGVSLVATMGDFNRTGQLSIFYGGSFDFPGFDGPDAFDLVTACSSPFDPSELGIVPSTFLRRDSGEAVIRPFPGDLIELRVQSAMTIDINDDGALDLFVGTEGSERDRVFLGRGDGTFLEAGLALGFTLETSAMGSDAADIDGDGDPEIIVADFLPVQGGPLYVRGEDGRFRDEAEARGLAELRQYSAWGLGFHDFDHDGDVDLLVVNGKPPAETCAPGDQERVYFDNDGKGHFTRRFGATGSGLDLSTRGRGAAFADFDGDGDVDVAVSSMDAPPQLMRNDMSAGAWIQFDLVYGYFRPAVGAVVRLRTGDIWQTRWVAGTPSAAGSSTEVVHFGLGDAVSVDEVRVRWPHGEEDVYGPFAVNRRERLQRSL